MKISNRWYVVPLLFQLERIFFRLRIRVWQRLLIQSLWRFFAGIMSPPLKTLWYSNRLCFHHCFYECIFYLCCPCTRFCPWQLFFIAYPAILDDSCFPYFCSFQFSMSFFAESKTAFRASVSLPLIFDGAMTLLQNLMSAFKTCVKWINITNVSTSPNPTRKRLSLIWR